jgi:hypothetical protein
MSAATVAASKTAAPPVSVRRNSRSGVCRFRAQAVRPVKDGGLAFGSALPLVALHDDHGRSLPSWAHLPALAVPRPPESRDGRALKPIHDWVKTHERSWSERFDELDVVLEELKQKEEEDGGND